MFLWNGMCHEVIVDVGSHSQVTRTLAVLGQPDLPWLGVHQTFNVWASGLSTSSTLRSHAVAPGAWSSDLWYLSPPMLWYRLLNSCHAQPRCTQAASQSGQGGVILRPVFLPLRACLYKQPSGCFS